MYCYECKINDIGLCFNCAKTKGFCLNCIAYGNGNYCLNCIQCDEAIDLRYDMLLLQEWVQKNNHFWKLKYLLSRATFTKNFIKK